MLFTKLTGGGRTAHVACGAVLSVAGCLSGIFSGAAAADGAQRVVPPPPRNLLYLAAKDHERGGNFAEAKAVYRMALHNGVTGAARREAFLGLARCEESEGNYWEAFKAVESSFPAKEDLLALAPAARGDEISRRLAAEMRLAAALAPHGAAEVGRKASGAAVTGWQAAAEVYYAVVYNNPQSELARQALVKRGDILRQAGDYAEAERSYRLLINSFPDTPEVVEAQISLAGLLAEKTAAEGGLRGDAERETVAIFRTAATLPNLAAPLKEKLQDAQQAVNENKAQALLAKVTHYYLPRGNRRERDAAKWMLNDIITRYPATTAATAARELLPKIP
jgi:TolA-binding protein